MRGTSLGIGRGRNTGRRDASERTGRCRDDGPGRGAGCAQPPGHPVPGRESADPSGRRAGAPARRAAATAPAAADDGPGGYASMIEGVCLCGAVRWRLQRQPDAATVCNCTACRRYGVLWAYGYENEGVTVSGPTTAFARSSALTFNFCPRCGCIAFWRGLRPQPDGRIRIAVNLRLAAPEPVAAIPIDRFDGLGRFEDLPRDGRCVVDYWF
jgi:hypothetical protein